jgi:hypothetical protein
METVTANDRADPHVSSAAFERLGAIADAFQAVAVC